MSPALHDDWERARAHLYQMQYATHLQFGWAVPKDEESYKHPEVIAHVRRVFLSQNPDGSDEDFEAMMEDYRRSQREQIAQLPTPFEDPGWYSVAKDCFAKLSKSAQEMSLPIAHEPLLGTLATGRVNGMAIGMPGVETRIILIEHGLFGFANLMCKAVAAAIPFTGKDNGQLQFSTDLKAIEAALEHNEEPARRFFEALSGYVVMGDAQHAQPYALPGHASVLADLMRDSMELFIIGHEMGHIALGHLEGKRVLCAVAKGVEAETVETNWVQELEADFIGMHLMVRSLLRERQVDIALSYWGADLFFGCVDVVERAVNLLVTGRPSTSPSSTHPPPEVRQAHLRKALLETVEPREAAEAAARLADIIDKIVERFWQRCEPVFLQMHRDAIRPALWWSADAVDAAG